MENSVSDLDYIMYFCINDKRIMRIHCNFLMPNSIETIKRWVIDHQQNFYTHIEIVYQGKPVSRIDIKSTV